MPQPLKVLIAEDNLVDAEMVLRELRRAGFAPDWTRVDTEAGFLAELHPGLDLILSDYTMPQFSGLRALELVKASGLLVPLILVSGTIGEDVAVAAMKVGAVDYLLKDRLTRLGPAVAHAVAENRLRRERQQAEEALRASEARFRTMLQGVDAGVVVHGADSRITAFNGKAAELLGVTREQMTGRVPFNAAWDRLRVDCSPLSGSEVPFQRALATKQSVRDVIFGVKRVEQGDFVWLMANANPVLSPAREVVEVIVTFMDVTARIAAEEALRRQQTELRVLFDLMPAMLWFKDTQDRILRVNLRAADLAGKAVSEIDGRLSRDVYPEDAARSAAIEREVIESGTARLGVVEYLRDPTGREFWLQTDRVPVSDKEGKMTGIIVMAQDITDRKRLEEALDKSQSQYQTLFENMLEGYARCQTVFEGERLVDFVYLEVNGTFDRMTGLHDVVGRRVSEVVPGIRETSPELFELYGRVALSGTPERVEAQVKSLGRWLAITVYSHEPDQFVVVFDNITERKRSEESLRLLGSAVEQARESILITDAELNVPGPRIVFVNPAFTAMTGYSAAEALGQTPRILQGPGTDRAVLSRLRTTLEQGGMFEGEAINYRKGGKEFTLGWQVAPIRDPAGTITHFVAIQRDITERKRAETELRNSEKRFKALFDQAAVGVAQIDVTTGRIVQVNQRLCEIAGRTVEEMMQITLREITHPEDVASSLKNLERILEGETRETTGEKRYRRKDGTEVWASVTSSAMWEKGEQPDFVVVIVQDVGERKRMEAQFFRAQRLESIGTLASGIAHDLNNILAPILMAPPIIRASATPEGVEKMLVMVETSALRGAKLVRQLLTFGRGSESGKVMLTVAPVVRDILAIAQQTFPKNITPFAEVAADSWPILADATQLHQVLLNLCVNARDAMPQGGVLTIATTNEHFTPEAAAKLPGAKVGDYVALSVTDTGTGMTPELIDRIFDPFFTTKEEGKGTGLGLATVLGLVKGHGGFVALESEPGRGSTFRVYFPAVPKSEGVLPDVCAVASPPGQGEMLLVVDNEENIRDVTSQTLVQHGYLAVVAEDGIEGIARYAEAEREIKLVITDLDMPHMDGLTMLKVMRKINPALKIIVVSGASGQSEMASRLHELRELGITTVLSKPFTSEQVLSAVHAALRVERRRPVEGVRRAW